MDLTGVYPPLVTPIDSEREIKTGPLRDHVKTLASAGVDGFFPCGSVGEFTSISHEQRSEVIQTVVNSSGKKPVLAGCGDTSINGVLNQTRKASKIGADVAVVVVPYYLKANQAGLEQYYSKVAQDSPLPVMIYNIPSLTDTTIDIETVVSLSNHSNIVGIKDSSGDPRYHSRLNTKTDASFTVLQGITDEAVVSLRTGSDGLVPAISNFTPKALVNLYTAANNGDYEHALRLHSSVVDNLLDSFRGVHLAAGLKYALRESGLNVGIPAPPLTELTPDEKQQVSDQIERIPEQFTYDCNDHLD